MVQKRIFLVQDRVLGGWMSLLLYSKTRSHGEANMYNLLYS
jgi:hypothetical protein